MYTCLAIRTGNRQKPQITRFARSPFYDRTTIRNTVFEAGVSRFSATHILAPTQTYGLFDQILISTPRVVALVDHPRSYYCRIFLPFRFRHDSFSAGTVEIRRLDDSRRVRRAVVATVFSAYTGRRRARS